MHMNIAEQIRAWEEKISTNVKGQAELTRIAAEDGEGRTFTEAEQKEYDGLQTEIESMKGQIARLKQLQENEKTSAVPAGEEDDDQPTEAELEEQRKAQEKKTDAQRLAVRRAPAYVRGIPEDQFAGQSFTRKAIAMALGWLTQSNPVAVAEKRWGKTNPLLVQWIKSDIEGHTGVSGEPGAELVSADSRFVGDFIEFLYSKTVYDQLNMRVVPANVTIKGQDGANTGYWVGEGRSIAPSEASFSSVNLTYKKVAGLAVMSKEWLRDSSPSGELLIRDSLADASSQALDTKFLSTDTVTASAPAGIFQGLAALGSNGATFTNVSQDIGELLGAFITAKNAGGELNFVMSKALAQAIALLRNTDGIKVFPEITREGGTLEGISVVTGDNVASDVIALVKPSDIYRIADTGVELEMSTEASIQMRDDPPAEILTPTTEGAPIVNMFQTDSVALKVTRSVNFAKRRTSAVAWIDDAGYGQSGFTTE